MASRCEIQTPSQCVDVACNLIDSDGRKNDIFHSNISVSPSSCPRFIQLPKILAPQSRQWKRTNDTHSETPTDPINPSSHPPQPSCMTYCIDNTMHQHHNAQHIEATQHPTTPTPTHQLRVHKNNDKRTPTSTLLHNQNQCDAATFLSPKKHSYLPNDLLIHCFQYLDIESLLLCKRVLKQWYHIINHEIEVWQYNIIQTRMIERHRLTLSSGRALLQILPSMKYIQHVDLNHSDITNYGVLYIATLLTHLHSLNLSYCSNITDSCGRYLSTLNYLHTLNLSYTSITDTCIQHLQNSLYELEYLNLTGCHRITNKTCQTLSQYAMNLHELFIGSADHHPHNHVQQSRDTATQATITSHGIQCLTSLPLLYKLHIYTILDNKGAYAISHIPSLIILSIEYIDDDAYSVCEYLGNMKSLKKLSIGMNDIHQHNIQRLCTQLSDLRGLELIVGKGIDDDICIHAISRLSKLKSLKITNVSHMSILGMKSLLSSLPALKELILCDNSNITTHQLQAVSCYTHIPDFMDLIQFERVQLSSNCKQNAYPRRRRRLYDEEAFIDSE